MQQSSRPMATKSDISKVAHEFKSNIGYVFTYSNGHTDAITLPRVVKVEDARTSHK